MAGPRSGFISITIVIFTRQSGLFTIFILRRVTLWGVRMTNQILKLTSPLRLWAMGGVVALISAMGTSAAAQDDLSGAYVNIGGAFLGADLQTDSFTTPATDIGGGITAPQTTFQLDDVSANAFLINGRLGYRLNSYFAIEVDGGFGLSGDSASQTFAVPLNTPLGPTTQDVDVNVNAEVNNYIIGFGRVILPADDNFDVFARAGYGTASLDVDGTVSVSSLGLGAVSAEVPAQSASADGFVFGGGAEYRLTEKHGLRADVSYFSGDINALYLAASYSYKF